MTAAITIRCNASHRAQHAHHFVMAAQAAIHASISRRSERGLRDVSTTLGARRATALHLNPPILEHVELPALRHPERWPGNPPLPERFAEKHHHPGVAQDERTSSLVELLTISTRGYWRLSAPSDMARSTKR